MSRHDLSSALHQAGAIPRFPTVVPREWSGPDRRRSLRVGLGEGLPVQISGAEEVVPCRLRELSLGGGMLEIGRKLGGDDSYVLHLDYQDSHASFLVSIYRNDLYELFYDTGIDSHVSFRARMVCRDPTIEDLNLLYRIMREYWTPWGEPLR